jgi:integrase
MGNYAKRAHGAGQVRYDEGRGCYRGQVTIDGKRRSVSGRTEGEARANLDKLVREAAEAAAAPEAEAEVPTLGAWLAQWVDETEGSANTVANRRWAVAHLATLHGHRLDRLTSLEVEAVLGAKQRHGLGRSSLVRIRTVLNQALNEAIRHRLVTENVCKVVRIPKAARPTSERRALTLDEVARLLEAAALDHEGIVVVLGYYLGLRPGEVCGLKWAEIDLEDEGALTVAQMRRREPEGALTFCEPKAKSGRTFVNLRPEVLEALRRHKVAQTRARLASRGKFTDNGLVVCARNGSPLDPSNHRRAVTRIAKAAGIFGGLTPNELRHTFATHFVGRGKSLTELSVAMGHKNERMGMLHYNHPGRIVDMGLGA